MAINYSGTRIMMNPDKVPTGTVKENVTPFFDQNYNTYKWDFIIDKASVESGTASAIFTNLVNFLGVAIESRLTNDFVASNNVEAYGDLFDVQSTLDTSQNPDVSDAYLNNPAGYYCKVNVKVKIS